MFLLSSLHRQGGYNGNKSENMCFIDLFRLWNVMGQLTSFPSNLEGLREEDLLRALGSSWTTGTVKHFNFYGTSSDKRQLEGHWKENGQKSKVRRQD